MRTKKVETNEIFGNALTTDKTADTEVKETGKTAAKKPATAKSAEKKTVKEDVAAKINEVKADIAEKKEEAKAVVEEAKAVVTEAKAAPAKKRGRKPAAEKAAKKTTRKTTAKKETAKKEPVKKEAETKPAVKRTTRKTTAKKALKKEVFFQYEGNQIDEETLLARIIEDAKSQNVEISELEMYIKPEDKACYYVANGFAGKVDLF